MTLDEKRQIVKDHYEVAYKGLIVDPKLPEAKVNELYTNILKLRASEEANRERKRAQATLRIAR